MMRLKIDVLKAPWPPGAMVGDVVEFASVPEWAAGKCHVTEEAATITHGTAAGDGSGQAAPEFVSNVEPDPLAVAAAQAAQELAAINRKAELLEQAKALGIKADGRWSAERLAAEIDKAKAAT